MGCCAIVETKQGPAGVGSPKTIVLAEECMNYVQTGNFFQIPNRETLTRVFRELSGDTDHVTSQQAFQYVREIMGDAISRDAFDCVLKRILITNLNEITKDQLARITYICINSTGASEETMLFLAADAAINEEIQFSQFKQIVEQLKLDSKVEDKIEGQAISYTRYQTILKRMKHLTKSNKE